MLRPMWTDDPVADNDAYQAYLEEVNREPDIDDWEDIYLDDYWHSEGKFDEVLI